MTLGAQPGFEIISDEEDSEGSSTSVRNIEAAALPNLDSVMNIKPAPPNRESTMKNFIRESRRVSTQIEEEV